MKKGHRTKFDSMQPAWRESTVNGARTSRWWLDATQCSELRLHRIAWLGIDDVQPPYERVRLAPSGSFFLASLAGEGRVWLEGRWQCVQSGSVCLAPPRVLNAFHVQAKGSWVVAWVRYEEPCWTKPLVGADSPLRLTSGAEELGGVIRGLKAEWEGERDVDLVRHWVSLVHGSARRFSRPWRTGSRASSLWEAVARNLATDWNLTTLARHCSVSTEHLRRLCRHELGRTPMEHVTYMRIQRAQEMLSSTDHKLEAIAPQLGYKRADVFSRAFTRCVGLTPSQYRQRRS